MRSIQKVETESDLQRVFNLAAGGETILISNPGIVVLSMTQYHQLSNSGYANKIEEAIKGAQAGDVVTKTMEELEAMAQ